MKKRNAWTKIAVFLAVALGLGTETVAWENGSISIDGIMYKYYRDGTASVGSYGNSAPSGSSVANLAAHIVVSNHTYLVTDIGNGAFYLNSNLENVAIPNSVTNIGGLAFGYCHNLESVTIPNSVMNIGQSAFEDCDGLTNVAIGNSVMTIGAMAFEGCNNLPSVTIPDSVTSIGSQAFEGCSGLTSVTIPNSVTNLGGQAFGNCTGLTAVTILGDISNDYGSIYASTPFLRCSNIESVVVGGKMTKIGDAMFSEWTDRITGTRQSFIGCSGLKNLTIGNSVTNIGNAAFDGCGNLARVTIGNGVTSIGFRTFRYCRGLTNMTIPDSVTNIGDDAFYSCSGLTSVTIPNGVTRIGSGTFSHCSGLTNVTIPNSVTSIGFQAFRYCRGLTIVTIPDSVTDLGQCAFDYCTGLTNVVIGNSVTNIGDDAFYNCSGLTSVTIGNSVTNIGFRAFYGCSNLASVTIGNSVTSIGDSAFYDCTALTNVTIPESVSHLGHEAFADCEHLVNVLFEGTPPDVGAASYWDWVPFHQIAEGAHGYYTAEHSAEWAEAIDEDGKWQGLIMKEVEEEKRGCWLHLHRNGWKATQEEADRCPPLWFEFGKGHKLPTKPFERGDCTFYGWSVGTPEYQWDEVHGPFFETGLVEDGCEWNPSEGDWEEWFSRGWVKEVEGKHELHLYGVWGTKTTCEFFFENAGWSEGESPLSAHMQVLFDYGPETAWHRGGEAVDLLPGWHSLTVRPDEGYEEYVPDWRSAVGGNVRWDEDLKKAAFYIPGTYDGQRWGGEDPSARLVLRALLMPPEEAGRVRFACTNIITELQGRVCPDFPAFDLNKIRIRLRKLEADGTEGKWIEAWPWGTGLALPPGTYWLEIGYKEKYWALSEPDRFRFTVETGQLREIPLCFRPFGTAQTLFARVEFDGRGGTPEANELWYQFDENYNGMGWNDSLDIMKLHGPGGLPNAERSDGWQLGGWYTEDSIFMDNMEMLVAVLKRTKKSLTLLAQWKEGVVPMPVYRFYSAKNKGHFFTISEAEKDNLIATNPNWKYERVAYRAFTNQVAGTVPLYRFYSQRYKGHFYTTSETEKNNVIANNPNWKYERIAYYVHPSKAAGTVPVYRFWSQKYGHHFYTTSEAEKQNLIDTNPNWKYERIAFYALPPEAAAAGRAAGGRTPPAPAGTSSGGTQRVFSVDDCGVFPLGAYVVEISPDEPTVAELGGREEAGELASPLAVTFRVPEGGAAWQFWNAESGILAEADVFAATVVLEVPDLGLWHWLRFFDEEGGTLTSTWLFPAGEE